METELFKDESPATKLQMLRDNADGVEQLKYVKSFSEEEMSEHRTELSEKMIILNGLETERKKMNDEFKVQIKPVKAEISELLTEVTHQSTIVTEECFKMLSQGENKAFYYNGNGGLVKTRPMIPEERQGNIFTLSQTEKATGTSD